MLGKQQLRAAWGRHADAAADGFFFITGLGRCWAVDWDGAYANGYADKNPDCNSHSYIDSDADADSDDDADADADGDAGSVPCDSGGCCHWGQPHVRADGVWRGLLLGVKQQRAARERVVQQPAVAGAGIRTSCRD